MQKGTNAASLMLPTRHIFYHPLLKLVPLPAIYHAVVATPRHFVLIYQEPPLLARLWRSQHLKKLTIKLMRMHRHYSTGISKHLTVILHQAPCASMVCAHQHCQYIKQSIPSIQHGRRLVEEVVTLLISFEFAHSVLYLQTNTNYMKKLQLLIPVQTATFLAIDTVLLIVAQLILRLH